MSRTAGLSPAVLILLLFSATSARAGQIFEFYNGIRALGMGGAYVNTVNDETAVVSNPAGLGKIRDLFVTVVDPELELSTDATGVINAGNYSEVIDTQGLLDALETKPGKHFHSRAQVFPSIVMPNFGVGILVKYQTDAEVSEDGTNYRLDYTNDTAFALGYNFRLFNGIIKLGVNARVVNRVEVAEDLDPASVGLELEQIAAEGVGVASDIGLLISVPVKFLPSLGAVVKDTGHTKYNLSDGMMEETGERRPRPTNQTIDAGLAIFPILTNYIRMTMTAEVHDVTNISKDKEIYGKVDFMRRFHGGLEFNIADFFFLRGGWHQHYYSAGFEFATEFFQLQAATYGEEIGTPTTPREDRRYVGKFSIRF